MKNADYIRLTQSPTEMGKGINRQASLPNDIPRDHLKKFPEIKLNLSQEKPVSQYQSVSKTSLHDDKKKASDTIYISNSEQKSKQSIITNNSQLYYRHGEKDSLKGSPEMNSKMTAMSIPMNKSKKNPETLTITIKSSVQPEGWLQEIKDIPGLAGYSQLQKNN